MHVKDVIAAATNNKQYSVIWRVSLGLGVVFPLVLLVLRIRLKEPEEFARHSMKRKTPYTLVLKYYWWRLMCVSIIWFLYDVRKLKFLPAYEMIRLTRCSSLHTLSASTLPPFWKVSTAVAMAFR